MKHYLIYLFSSVIAVMLVGCTGHQGDYLKRATVVPPMTVPAGISVQPGQSYYPVPAARSVTETTAPSLVPPDSHLQRFQKKVQIQQKQASLVSGANAQPSVQPLVLAEKESVAWVQVGKALRKTDYKVLDEDAPMASYYVLDEKSTGNKTTKQTPIYRVVLQAAGSNTSVVLLDKSNQPAAPEVSQRILAALKGQL